MLIIITAAYFFAFNIFNFFKCNQAELLKRALPVVTLNIQVRNCDTIERLQSPHSLSQ